MRIKVERLLGTEEESYVWMLCCGTSQICGGPVFLKADDAIAHAELFIQMFNDPNNLLNKRNESNTISLVKSKKPFEIIDGGKLEF